LPASKLAWDVGAQLGRHGVGPSLLHLPLDFGTHVWSMTAMIADEPGVERFAICFSRASESRRRASWRPARDHRAASAAQPDRAANNRSRRRGRHPITAPFQPPMFGSLFDAQLAVRLLHHTAASSI